MSNIADDVTYHNVKYWKFQIWYLMVLNMMMLIFSQVTWAESEKVGCAKKYCSSVNDFTINNLPGYLVVCNYGPGYAIDQKK